MLALNPPIQTCPVSLLNFCTWNLSLMFLSVFTSTSWSASSKSTRGGQPGPLQPSYGEQTDSFSPLLWSERRTVSIQRPFNVEMHVKPLKRCVSVPHKCLCDPLGLPGTTSCSSLGCTCAWIERRPFSEWREIMASFTCPLTLAVNT